eukprot:6183549-Pleurochrysis_carterae.AAC.3
MSHLLVLRSSKGQIRSRDEALSLLLFEPLSSQKKNALEVGPAHRSAAVRVCKLHELEQVLAVDAVARLGQDQPQVGGQHYCWASDVHRGLASLNKFLRSHPSTHCPCLTQRTRAGLIVRDATV